MEHRTKRQMKLLLHLLKYQCRASVTNDTAIYIVGTSPVIMYEPHLVSVKHDTDV